MKNLILTTCLVLTASPAVAGGLVTLEDRYDLEVAGDRAGVNPLVIVGGLVLACLILCRGDADAPVAVVVPPPCNGKC